MADKKDTKKDQHKDSKKDPKKNHGAEEIPLDEDDDRILKEVWEEISRKRFPHLWEKKDKEKKEKEDKKK